jgi:hypothetical protein
MNKLSYSIGVAALLIWLIIRFSFPKKTTATFKNWTIEKKAVDDVEILIALMGIFWIVLGLFLTFTKVWLESSIWGMILQFIIILSPILFFRVILWFKNKRKGGG